jgi:hypothetical protein
MGWTGADVLIGAGLPLGDGDRLGPTETEGSVVGLGTRLGSGVGVAA